jgi:hypothetical protein
MIDFDNLSPEEQRRLEKLLTLNQKTVDRLVKVAEQDERMEWLWAATRRAASFVAIVLGSIALFFEQIKAALRSMIQ